MQDLCQLSVIVLVILTFSSAIGLESNAWQRVVSSQNRNVDLPSSYASHLDTSSQMKDERQSMGIERSVHEDLPQSAPADLYFHPTNADTTGHHDLTSLTQSDWINLFQQDWTSPDQLESDWIIPSPPHWASQVQLNQVGSSEPVGHSFSIDEYTPEGAGMTSQLPAGTTTANLVNPSKLESTDTSSSQPSHQSTTDISLEEQLLHLRQTGFPFFYTRELFDHIEAWYTTRGEGMPPGTRKMLHLANKWLGKCKSDALEIRPRREPDFFNCLGDTWKMRLASFGGKLCKAVRLAVVHPKLIKASTQEDILRLIVGPKILGMEGNGDITSRMKTRLTTKLCPVRANEEMSVEPDEILTRLVEFEIKFLIIVRVLNMIVIDDNPDSKRAGVIARKQDEASDIFAEFWKGQDLFTPNQPKIAKKAGLEKLDEYIRSRDASVNHSIHIARIWEMASLWVNEIMPKPRDLAALGYLEAFILTLWSESVDHVHRI